MLNGGDRVGDYEVLQRLGGGGIGEVYRARHCTQTGSIVALKVLHQHYAEHPEVAARFAREAKATQLLAHPYIVQVHEYVQLPNSYAFIVMENLSGENLYEFIKHERGGLPLAQIIAIFRQLVSALDYAHHAGVIHRDLKLSNVMVCEGLGKDQESPRIKLLDFGIAKAIGADFTDIGTSNQSIMGTYEYMPPEQFRDASSVTERSDVYSLGVMLYCCLTGSPPFKSEPSADHNAELLYYHHAHTTQNPPPLPETVPVPVRRLVVQMLAKDPAARPSMADVGQALVALEQQVAPSEASTRPGAAPLGSLLAQPEPARLGQRFLPTTTSRSTAAWMAFAIIALVWAVVATVLLIRS